jgi:hypothetical protein
MTLDPRYVLQQDIDSYFVDKLTGLPLAGGEVWFFHDNNRNSLKSVYQLTWAPPNYTYTPMSNPVILNAGGSYSSNGVNNVAIYYLPFDANDNIDLYYVAVFKAGQGPMGVPQLTREAWPNTFAQAGGDVADNAPVNMLSNPEFADVNFDTAVPLVITIAGIVANQDYDIAPSWKLRVTTTGAATITVSRDNVTGTQKLANNPSYILNVTGGANVSNILLVQRLYNDASIWSANSTNQFGYVASTLCTGPASSSVTMTYSPSNGTAQQLMSVTNNTGTYKSYTNTVQLIPGTNTDNSTTGYVDIILTLPAASLIRLSTIQCIGMHTSVLDVPYDQSPVNRQRDHLAHYYKPQLAYKPIPSYLVGWDFPLNPAQHGTTFAAPAIGANKSQYNWDQTIVFQSIDSSIGVSRGTSGGLVLTATLAGQVAVIQYLDAVEARKILHDKMAVNIDGFTDVVGGIRGKVTLWATAEAALPNIAAGTNNSIVATLDASGKPATFNGINWVEVPRNLGDASFTLPVASATNDNSQDIMLNGWDIKNAVPTNTATFFAIVVGFANLTITHTITLNSVSLCAGDIATRPAPKTIGETLLDCQRYFYSTFGYGVAPVQNAGINTGYPEWQALLGASDSTKQLRYPVPMRVNPNIVSYNPVAAATTIRNFTAATNIAFAATPNTTATAIVINAAAAGTQGDNLGVHFSSDARLGIV